MLKLSRPAQKPLEPGDALVVAKSNRVPDLGLRSGELDPIAAGSAYQPVLRRQWRFS